MAGEYSYDDLSGVMGTGLYDNLFSTLGFSGYNDGQQGDNPWMDQLGFNEGNDVNWSTMPNQNALNSINGYSFNWQPTGGQGGALTAFNPTGQSVGTWQQKDEDPFTKLVSGVAPAVASWGFGGALAPMFGGGVTGGAVGQGLASGTMSSIQGGSFGQGALSGAVSGGLQGLGKAGTSLAGAAGIDNPTLAGMFNRGAGSILGALASGQNGSDALRSGLTGAALSGINSVGKMGMDFFNNSFKDWLSPSTDAGGLPDDLMGSGGDMSGMTDVSPNRYEEFITGPDNLTTYNPDYGFGGDQLANTFSSGLAPQQSTQSADFSLPSIFGNTGNALGGVGMSALRGLGNYALNNAGDLASMLYGFYNNRRQQKALGQQMSSLQNMMTQAPSGAEAGAKLFGQDSPYAIQLRNKLNAQAAATGRRSNVSGRETQLQAMLAEKNAQIQAEYDRNKTSLVSNLAPQLYQLTQAQNSLKNNNMNMLLQGAGKMGMFNGLGSLFNRNPMGNYSMANNTNDYNLLGMLEGGR